MAEELVSIWGKESFFELVHIKGPTRCVYTQMPGCACGGWVGGAPAVFHVIWIGASQSAGPGWAWISDLFLLARQVSSPTPTLRCSPKMGGAGGGVAPPAGPLNRGLTL